MKRYERYDNMLNIVRERILFDIKTFMSKNQEVYFRNGILVSGEGFSGGNIIVRGVELKSDNLRLLLDDGYSSDFYVEESGFPTCYLIWVLSQLEEKDYVLTTEEVWE